MLVLVAFRHNSNIVLEGTAQASMHCTECLLIRALAVIRLLHECRNLTYVHMAACQRSPCFGWEVH